MSRTLSPSHPLSPFSLAGTPVILMLDFLDLQFSYFLSYFLVFIIFTYYLGISSTLSSNPFTELFIVVLLYFKITFCLSVFYHGVSFLFHERSVLCLLGH